MTVTCPGIPTRVRGPPPSGLTASVGEAVWDMRSLREKEHAGESPEPEENKARLLFSS